MEIQINPNWFEDLMVGIAGYLLLVFIVIGVLYYIGKKNWEDEDEENNRRGPGLSAV
jgi:predicted negative regulator of RcsB-dependent stress response